MMPCPTPEFVARYRGGSLRDVEEAQAFDTHLQTCGKCRQDLRAQTAYAAPALAAQLLPEETDPLHLDDAQMLNYVRGDLGEVEREIVASHLETCARCTADIANLAAFHQQMEEENFDRIEREVARPTWRERAATAFASCTHVFGVGTANRLLAWWNTRSLNWRLVFAVCSGVCVGLLLRHHAADLHDVRDIFLSLLQALATPFIFVAIVHTLMDAEVTGRTARRLAYLALSNTIVAVAIGLFVANVARPGAGANMVFADQVAPANPLRGLPVHVPHTLLQPLLENNILFVVLLAVAFGLSLRMVRREQIKSHHKDYQVVESLLTATYRSLTIMLNWIVAFVPLAVFAVIAELVGTLNIKLFISLLGFTAAVVFALALHIAFYLTRLWFRASIAPGTFLRAARDAVLTAFSTASSAATLPVTYTSVRDRVGVRERSAGLGVLVGAHFNRDGTALYEAITPLFIAQALGRPLDLTHQLTVGFMAVIASIAAPGIPGAGLVTMVLVFQSVGLPIACIPLLLAVDWFLDRCRTSVNVLGGMTMTCLLDRRSPSPANPPDLDDVLEPEIVT